MVRVYIYALLTIPAAFQEVQPLGPKVLHAWEMITGQNDFKSLRLKQVAFTKVLGKIFSKDMEQVL